MKPSLTTGCLQAAGTSVIKVMPVLGIVGCGQHERFSVLLLEQTTAYSLKMEKAILTPTKFPMTFSSHGLAAIPPSFVSSSNLSAFRFFPCTSDTLHTHFCFIFSLTKYKLCLNVSSLAWQPLSSGCSKSDEF